MLGSLCNVSSLFGRNACIDLSVNTKDQKYNEVEKENEIGINSVLSPTLYPYE